MKHKTSAEKFEEYESLKQEAHRKVDTLTRAELKKFLKRSGPTPQEERNEH